MKQMADGITLIRGQTFDFNDPAACELDIRDVAAPLANICRFAGQMLPGCWYSVAQHLVNTSRIVAPEHAFDALMHDTAEAFTNDIVRPLKVAVPKVKEFEVAIERDMARRFGSTYPMHPAVHLADNQMLWLEMRNVCGWDPDEYEHLRGLGAEQLRGLVDLSSWPPMVAYTRFMRRYEELRP